jgi:hypothetical protein
MEEETWGEHDDPGRMLRHPSHRIFGGTGMIPMPARPKRVPSNLPCRLSGCLVGSSHRKTVCHGYRFGAILPTALVVRSDTGNIPELVFLSGHSTPRRERPQHSCSATTLCMRMLLKAHFVSAANMLLNRCYVRRLHHFPPSQSNGYGYLE